MVTPTTEWPRSKEEPAEMCTVQEVKQRRSKLEQQIALLLQDFQERTGIPVVEIEIKSYTQSTVGRSFSRLIAGDVRIKLEI